jgi:PAS domain S-box-containing protein
LLTVKANHWSVRYGIAVASLFCSTASLLLSPAISRTGAALPLIAVLISARFGGIGPGVFTIVVGVMLYVIVFLSRGNLFDSLQILQIALFAVGGAIITALVEVLQAARRRAESNERWLSAVLSSIGDAVIATDGQGRVAFTNAVARSLTGWTEADAKGKPLQEVFAIVSRDDGQPVETPVARVMREGVVVARVNHTSLIARDGTERPIADSAAPIKDDQNNIVGSVLVFRDVTDKHRHELERERLPSRPIARRTVSWRCWDMNCEPR